MYLLEMMSWEPMKDRYVKIMSAKQSRKRSQERAILTRRSGCALSSSPSNLGILLVFSLNSFIFLSVYQQGKQCKYRFKFSY